MRVLLVEDDESLRNLVHQCLLEVNHRVTAVADGKEAQEALAKSWFDLVICDLHMPEVDGISLFKWCREHRPIPFILMTGRADILDQNDFENLNINNFLIKPFMRSDLYQAIEEVCGKFAAA